MGWSYKDCGAINDLPRGSVTYRDENNKKKDKHFYNTWIGMLERCFSKKHQEKHPTYKGCTVCDEWKLLSNFKKWYDKQHYLEGWHLDKDILVPNNKIYSPETCRFVPSKINNLLTTCGKSRGKHLIGATWNDRDNTFYTISSRSLNEIRKDYNLPCVANSEIEAHNRWRFLKSKHIVKVLENSDNICSDIKSALLVRAEKLLDYDLPLEEFY